jgi:tetratricopeptide (TPR) repeat protein
MGFCLLAGCGGIAHSWYLHDRDRDIANATQAVEAARDDAQRAAAYTSRGRAYSDKARYSRVFKLIRAEESERLFALAIHDHDQAVALNPGSAEMYFDRGQTYFDRASVEQSTVAKTWLNSAALDFQKAVEKDPHHDRALDLLGVVHTRTGELDLAIADFTAEMALNQLGKARLPDAYCLRGSSNQAARKYDAAIADYEKSIELGAPGSDGCACDPYNQLIALCAESHRYDKGWEVVSRAKKAGIWVEPEFVQALKKDSHP